MQNTDVLEGLQKQFGMTTRGLEIPGDLEAGPEEGMVQTGEQPH